MSRRSLITDSYKVVKGKNDGRKRARKEEKVQEPGGDKGRLRNRTIVSTLEEKRALERLRDFDLEWRYGPCTGITRLERWERAEFLGLQPPKSIKDLVLQHKDDPRFVNNLWSDYPL